MMRPLGPGMMQQIQQPCGRCNQTGYATPAHDTCTDCSGKVRTFLKLRPTTSACHASQGGSELFPCKIAAPHQRGHGRQSSAASYLPQ